MGGLKSICLCETPDKQGISTLNVIDVLGVEQRVRSAGSLPSCHLDGRARLDGSAGTRPDAWRLPRDGSRIRLLVNRTACPPTHCHRAASSSILK